MVDQKESCPVDQRQKHLYHIYLTLIQRKMNENTGEMYYRSSVFPNQKGEMLTVVLKRHHSPLVDMHYSEFRIVNDYCYEHRKRTDVHQMISELDSWQMLPENHKICLVDALFLI